MLIGVPNVGVGVSGVNMFVSWLSVACLRFFAAVSMFVGRPTFLFFEAGVDADTDGPSHPSLWLRRNVGWVENCSLSPP